MLVIAFFYWHHNLENYSPDLCPVVNLPILERENQRLGEICAKDRGQGEAHFGECFGAWFQDGLRLHRVVGQCLL